MENFLVRESSLKLSVTLWPKGNHLLPSSRYRIYGLLKYLDQSTGFKFFLAECKISNLKSLCKWLKFVIRSKVFVFQKRYIDYPMFIIMKIFKVKIIYDFDDALFARRSWSASKGKTDKHHKKKLNRTLRLSHHVIVSNDYLKKYATSFNKNISVIPTMVPVASELKSYHEQGKLVIGWTGTKENFIYLKSIENVLVSLYGQHGDKLQIKIISNGLYHADSEAVPIENIHWTPGNELSELLSFDIGIMPLIDDDWSKGKGMFKALQMMSVGIPVVVSKVGVNEKLITDNVNGYLADREDEWIEKLTKLIDTSDLRKSIGLKGREFVRQSFNPQKHADQLTKIIMDLANR